jgi:HlyD family secretion protein
MNYRVIARTLNQNSDHKPSEESSSAKLRSEVKHRIDAEVLNTVRPNSRWSGAARLLLFLFLIGVGIGTYAGVKRYYQPTPPQYRTEQCRRGDLVVTVAATGTLDPTNVVEIGCEISGTIKTLEVDVNDPVKSGDLLFTLDTQELKAQVAKSRAMLAVREAELQLAESTFVESKQRHDRLKKLLKANAASAEEFDVASANLARAEANIASAKAQILVAQATLDGDLSKLQKSQVFAPIDGIVLTRNVEPGQTIAATFQTPVLLTICEDLSRMKLRVDIDEADVGGVREGQTASFTVDAYPNDIFPATISSLRFVSQRVQDVVTYEAVLEVANEERKLRPGMTAVADIVTTEIRDALLVPNAALRFTPDDDLPNLPIEADESLASRVWLLEENKPIPAPIRTGHTDGRYTEIKGNALDDGMPVVVDVIR